MAATAGLSLTLDPMGENVSKCFFSETTWTVETKLPRNAFEHFPIGSNVNVPAVAAILNF
jgi:carbamoylphosphate synthase large subunit